MRLKFEYNNNLNKMKYKNITKKYCYLLMVTHISSNRYLSRQYE